MNPTFSSGTPLTPPNSLLTPRPRLRESLPSVLAEKLAARPPLVERLRNWAGMHYLDGHEALADMLGAAALRIEVLEQALRDIRAGADNPCRIVDTVLGESKR